MKKFGWFDAPLGAPTDEIVHTADEAIEFINDVFGKPEDYYYSAADLRAFFKVIFTNGIVPEIRISSSSSINPFYQIGNSFAASTTDSGVITVNPGTAIIDGAYFMMNTEETMTAPMGMSDIVLRLDVRNESIIYDLFLKERGNAGSLIDNLTRENGVYELGLFSVERGNGYTKLYDHRMDMSIAYDGNPVCGMVGSLLQPDISEWYNNAVTALNDIILSKAPIMTEDSVGIARPGKTLTVNEDGVLDLKFSINQYIANGINDNEQLKTLISEYFSNNENENILKIAVYGNLGISEDPLSRFLITVPDGKKVVLDFTYANVPKYFNIKSRVNRLFELYGDCEIIGANVIVDTQEDSAKTLTIFYGGKYTDCSVAADVIGGGTSGDPNVTGFSNCECVSCYAKISVDGATRQTQCRGFENVILAERCYAEMMGSQIAYGFYNCAKLISCDANVGIKESGWATIGYWCERTICINCTGRAYSLATGIATYGAAACFYLPYKQGYYYMSMSGCHAIADSNDYHYCGILAEPQPEDQSGPYSQYAILGCALEGSGYFKRGPKQLSGNGTETGTLATP